MKHASQTEFGRADKVCPVTEETGPDKWQLLQLLTETSEDFGLTHRTLGVLKALLTFLPGRAIPHGPGAVVFPSNRTLSHRLSGMPESTLRRHLAKLVAAGVVSRQDSPNRKRFARHMRGGVALAFGFDLSPLAQMGQTLQQKAQEARELQEHLMLLRTEVMTLRAQLIASRGDDALTDAAALLLRRKPDAVALKAAIQELSNAVNTLDPAPKMSGSDSQSERHIHANSEYEQTKPADKSRPPSRNEADVSLDDISNHCTGVRELFPDAFRNWRDLTGVANRLAPMLGIESTQLENGSQEIGERRTSIIVLCVLEQFDHLKNPSGYFQHLVQSVKVGSLKGMALLEVAKRHNCQLTTRKIA